MKRILGAMRKAIEEHNMIEEGDRVAVGVSGGKDSMLLLEALRRFQTFSPCKFELLAVTVDLGFETQGIDKLEDYYKENDINYEIINTNISKIVFEEREEKNPCSLCSKMRKGAINIRLKELGYNRLAMGHHADDLVETLFMSMFFEGRLKTFKPVTYLTRKEIYSIKPFIYLKEKQIINEVERSSIPVFKSPCPLDKETKREEIKNLMKVIYKDIPDGRERIITAIKNSDKVELW
jgi:tRNA(Ile)-lysidine synthase TilS/MesJ